VPDLWNENVEQTPDVIVFFFSFDFQGLLLVAFASLTGYTGHTIDDQHKGRYDFFYFATVTTWLLVIIIFLLYTTKINRRVNINWNLAVSLESYSCHRSMDGN